MTLEQAQTLLDYHYWARDRVLTAVAALSADQYTKDLGNSFKSVRDTLVHTYGAEWLWYLRWTGNAPTSLPDPAAVAEFTTLCDEWKLHEPKVRQLVASLGDNGMHRVFDYRLLNGTETRSVFWHMLQHVVNHGTYHRGQVTTMLRQLGAEAPKQQDLIQFYRERQ